MGRENRTVTILETEVASETSSMFFTRLRSWGRGSIECDLEGKGILRVAVLQPKGGAIVYKHRDRVSHSRQQRSVKRASRIIKDVCRREGRSRKRDSREPIRKGEYSW